MLAKSQCRQPELGVSIRGANAPLARYSRYEERPRWALPTPGLEKLNSVAPALKAIRFIICLLLKELHFRNKTRRSNHRVASSGPSGLPVPGSGKVRSGRSRPGKEAKQITKESI